MYEIIRAISQSSVTVFISLLFGVIGIALAVIFYIISTRKRLPRYAVRSFNFIDEYATSIPKLQVTYDASLVKRLTVTKLAFWNAGSEIIGRNDIAEADPLRVTLSEGNVFLFARVTSQSIPANCVTRTIDEENRKTVPLSFDFLDRGQGAVLVFLHTGISSSDVELRGTIKGGKRIVRVVAEPRNWIWIVSAFFIGPAVALLLISFMEEWFYLIPIVGAAIIFGYFITDRLSRGRSIPSSLKAFADPFLKSEFA